MICRLTHTQARAIEIRMPEMYGQALRDHRVTRGRTQHDYDLPAIAWRQILDGMVAQCFGPAGGKLKGAGRPSDSVYRAIAKVAETVRLAEGHPALRNAAVEGWVGDIVPAFTDWVDSRCSPYPRRFAVDGAMWSFVLLVPQHGENLGMKVTRWEPTALQHHWSAGRSWTFEPESHLLFSRSPAADAQP